MSTDHKILTKYKLLTWNILAPVWIREALYPNINKKYLDVSYRIDCLSEYLINESADIVILQEIQPTMLQDIINRVKIYDVHLTVFNNGKYFSDWYNSDDLLYTEFKKEENGMALLIKKTVKMNVSDCQAHEWQSGNVNFSFKINDVSLFTCHLDVGDINVTSDQFLYICNNYQVIVGDLNLEAKQCRQILGDNYHSALELSDKIVTCADGRIIKQLDNIISKNQAIDIDSGKVPLIQLSSNYTVTECTNYLMKKYGSDHLPVSAEIYFPSQI